MIVYYDECILPHCVQSLAKSYKDKKNEEQQEKGHSIEMLETSMKLFYWISGAPGIGVKTKLEHYKAFAQSTSQGSRCLKSKKLLLYKVQNV